MENVISVVDRYTGQALDLPPEVARNRIEEGSAVETASSFDVAAAEEWRSDLRARVFSDAVERGIESDIKPFREFERWCASQGLHGLPVRVEDVTFYLLSLMRAGVPKHEAVGKAYSVERIQTLTNHPPRQLAHHVLNGVTRALGFAKLHLPKAGLTEEIDQAAARQALEMFPGGIVPKRYEVG